jgi:fructokinase
VTRELLNEPAPAALVFGTLALRNSANRRALATLCSTWKTTLRVLDLNLRPPFDQPAAISFAIKLAQVIKLNDEELSRLTHLPVRTERQLKAATLALAKQLSCARLCVTAGARGAALLWDGSWHWENGRKIVVRDTVGAGDSFLGSLLTSLIAQHASPATALARAARLGEFIASRDGATPPYRINAQGLPVDA